MTLTLTPEQIEAVQNALSFAVWQFPKGGDDELDEQAKILSKLHEQIRQETKIKGIY